MKPCNSVTNNHTFPFTLGEILEENKPGLNSLNHV